MHACCVGFGIAFEKISSCVQHVIGMNIPGLVLGVKAYDIILDKVRDNSSQH